MSTSTVVLLAALPWLAVPSVILWRLRRTTRLGVFPPTLPTDAPLVSVIVPARNETRNIEPCVRSILAATWPAIEVIVVDDHSSDGTGDIALRISADDPRVRVIGNPDLPDGWIGKQWACHNGQLAAHGTFLLFTDADTRHGPALLARSMNAMRERRADLFSVAGAQVMETFWERLLQPHVFGMLFARFGSTDRTNESRNPLDKIANGQFMLMRREVYGRAGGHAAVRTHVAEDLRFAQEWTRLGYSVHVVEGFDDMSTRMYAGFGEIWRGWGKNIWAAGRDTIQGGRAMRALIRLVAPLVPLWEVVPTLAIVVTLLGFAPVAVGIWGAIAYALCTLFWVVLHVAFRAPAWYAFLNPLASFVLVALFVRAAWRGDKVEWKGREYRSR
ncbi:MAG: glycosyltransferase [Gemmatimonadales bacterium]